MIWSVACHVLKLSLRTRSIYFLLALAVCATAGFFYVTGTGDVLAPDAVEEFQLKLQYTLFGSMMLTGLAVFWQAVSTFTADLEEHQFNQMDASPLSRMNNFLGRALGFSLQAAGLLFVIALTFTLCSIVYRYSLPPEDRAALDARFARVEYIVTARSIADDEKIQMLIEDQIRALKNSSEYKELGEARMRRQIREEVEKTYCEVTDQGEMILYFDIPARNADAPIQIELHPESFDRKYKCQARFEVMSGGNVPLFSKHMHFSTSETLNLEIPPGTVHPDAKQLALKIINLTGHDYSLAFPRPQGPYLKVEATGLAHNVLAAFATGVIWFITLILLALTFSAALSYAVCVFSGGILLLLSLNSTMFWELLKEPETSLVGGKIMSVFLTLIMPIAVPDVLKNLAESRIITWPDVGSWLIASLIAWGILTLCGVWAIHSRELDKYGRNA